MNLLASLSNTGRKPAIAIATATAILCGFLLVLPGCHIPDLRSPDLAPPLPPDAVPAASAENSAQLRIEEFFNDPILLNLIGQALAGNQELRILNEDIQIANNVILNRIGTYLPYLTVGGGPGLTKASSFLLEGAGLKDDPFRPGQFIPNPYGSFLLGANITWQIDVWRQLRNARDAAIMRYFSTSEGRNYLVTRLVAEIAENYFGLIALDKRLENLDTIIAIQEQSLRFAQARFAAARGTLLAVQRFQAEVAKNQAEKLIIKQEVIQVENRINYLVGRFPQPVPRASSNRIEDFIDLNLHALAVGVPSQLLQNRPDIRQRERELVAAGLDVKVARARFYPVVAINGGLGYGAFNMKYLFITPEALIGNIAGGLIGPLVNFSAIRAEYMSANAQQLQAVYEYQRTIINAVVEVVNRLAKVQNYATSIDIKKQQVRALEASVESATSLFQNARVEYMDVLFAQRDLLDARKELIDTKREQLSAVVNAYQALGGGGYLMPIPNPGPPPMPHPVPVPPAYQ